MASIIYLCMCLAFLFEYSCGQREKKFFRKDYHYIETTKSFYAIQVIPQNWHNAVKLCEWQGAILFYPDDEVEAEAVRSYVNQKQEFSRYWLGISELLAEGSFVSVDGFPVADKYNKWNRGEPNNLNGPEECVEMWNPGFMNDISCDYPKPYICKKELASVKWNSLCNMAYTDYIYNETLRRCYKLHTSPKNWRDAFSVCNSELSYLAVIDSQDEAEFFHDILQSEGDIQNSYNGTAHLGFHNRIGDSWKTVKGTKVEEEYFIWGEGQPDGLGVEKCGAMAFDGQLHDVDCAKQSYFICEHETDRNTLYSTTATTK